jgi:beta-lactamase class A
MAKEPKPETMEEYSNRIQQEAEAADMKRLGCTEGKSTNLEETDRPFEMLSENQANTSSPQQPPETANEDDKKTFEETVLGARMPTSEIGRGENHPGATV